MSEPAKKATAKASDVVFLEQLLEHKGWLIVRKWLADNLAWLTEKALNDTDSSLRKTTTISKRDLIIIRRKYNELLLELPEDLLNAAKAGTPFEQPSDPDPYLKDSDFE